MNIGGALDTSVAKKHFWKKLPVKYCKDAAEQNQERKEEFKKHENTFLGGKKALVTQLPRCFLSCALLRKRVSLDWHCANNILCILLYLVVFCIALYFSAHTKKGSPGTDTELTRHFVTLFARRLLGGGCPYSLMVNFENLPREILVCWGWTNILC